MLSIIKITVADDPIIRSKDIMTLLADFIITLETVFAIVINMDLDNTFETNFLLDFSIDFVNFGISLS